jgi:hypothetical protein
MNYESTSPVPRPSPVDTETLERLFDEVLQACRTGDIPFTSPGQGSGDSVYSVDVDNFTSPEEGSESHRSVNTTTPASHGTDLLWSPSFEYDEDHDNEIITFGSPPVPSRSTPRTNKTVPKEERKRFIPSGRSFQPLRAIKVSNTAMLTGTRRDDTWQNSKGRVREAVAKFETVAAGDPPTTPIRGQYTRSIGGSVADDSDWSDS